MNTGLHGFESLARHLAVLHVTYRGQSGYARHPVSWDLDVHALVGIAVESLESGDIPGITSRKAYRAEFTDYHVERFPAQRGRGEALPNRIYLRPKTPVG